MNILVINPGSTSTKLAAYEDRTQLWQVDIPHGTDLNKNFPTIFDQLDMRCAAVLETLAEKGMSMSDFACVMARGGLIPPCPAGAIEVNDSMLEVLRLRPVIHHASNLGAAIAVKLAAPLGIKSYIYDPVTVDEMIDLVRVTGLADIERAGKGHNLNMRAAALKYCRENGLDYGNSTIIVAHVGGGSTLTLHKNGRIIDMISDDEGPFSPERAGALPTYKLVNKIFDEGFTKDGILRELQRLGGLTALLGTTDAREVERRISEGDERAKLVYEAMALSVARSIASLSVVVNGKADAIVLTGGIARSEMFSRMVRERVEFIAPFTVIPGENEMQALADGAYRVLTGEETARVFVDSTKNHH